MRKWSFILLCLTALAGLIVLVGCEGDTGLTGGQGAKGRRGTAGYDPDQLPPADRVFAFAVTNATENAISGKRQAYLTFDSTAKATRDTVVAGRVSVPPLIDGLDGEEYEWGAQKSKMPLSFLNPDPGVADCKLKNGVVRAAYDDDNIYFQFQWQEQRVAPKINGEEVVVADVGESKELNQLSFFYRGPRADGSANMTLRRVKLFSCQPDSGTDTSYALVRVTYHPLCLYNDGDTCGCWDLRPTNPPPDISYLWVLKPGGEDRLVVFFPDEAATGWQDVAFKQFFGFTSTNPEMPSNFFVDVWGWGAARTMPVEVADDWNISAAGAKPDLGQAPYIDNYIPADSFPRYMNRRDPNVRTSESAAKSTAAIYPLRYFDAVPYSRVGWAEGIDSTAPAARGLRVDCYLPGIITTVSSGSRADVYTAARFDNGVWTVEMKRARRTHNGDDVQF